jgi:hypothetical protein
MNEHDRDNLMFILTSPQEVLRDWWDTIDELDKIYALELLQKYREELSTSEQYYDAFKKAENKNMDVTEAKSVLKKFTLRG